MILNSGTENERDYLKSSLEEDRIYFNQFYRNTLLI